MVDELLGDDMIGLFNGMNENYIYKC